ncbi:glycosyl hydrolase [Halarchaeum grantii]|uniref:Glycosyl hydrolase n=1 Tax=Halarchaeum grantii TaxID=1193105 RepID=A0A830F0A8_9EURY|nr:hypothetical protein [Halarchaeum grantii]GGL26963.1 glycosyl hydrolase [Halarchaeum grantii]
MKAFCAFPSGLFVVEDGEVRERLGDVTPTCVAVSGDTVCCGTSDAGIRRSVDGGESFHRVADFERAHVTALAVGPDGTWWAGTEPSALYRSDDGGRAWRETAPLTNLDSSDEWSFPPRPDTHHVRWVRPRPDDGDALAVAIEAGALVRTTDGGDTWRERVPGGPLDAHTIATHPGTPDRLYAAAGDGYHESPDWGETWETPESGLEHTYCWSVAATERDPDTRVLSAASGPRAAHSEGGAAVYRREAGTDWTRVPAISGDDLLAPVLAAGAGRTVYALSNHGLHRSTDGGRTWRRVALGYAPEERATGLALAP